MRQVSMHVDFKRSFRCLPILHAIILTVASQWAGDHKTPVDNNDHWWSDDQWANAQPIPNQRFGGARQNDPWIAEHAWSSLNSEGSGQWDSDWNNFNNPVQSQAGTENNGFNNAYDPYLAASLPSDAGSGNLPSWDDEDSIYSSRIDGSGFAPTSWHDIWDNPKEQGSSPFDKIDTDRIPLPPMPGQTVAETTERSDSWWIQPESDPVYTLPPTSDTTIMPPWYNAETTRAVWVEPTTTPTMPTTTTTATTYGSKTSSATTTTRRPPTTSTRRTTYWDVTTRNPYWEVTTSMLDRPTETSISIYDTRLPTSLKDRFVDLFFKPGILAAIIGGAVVGLIAAILLVFFIVYRMRKKDEGSYALDEPKSPGSNPYAYQKANTKEFYA